MKHLAHACILEPDKFKATYKVCGPRNTKAGKEEAKEAIESGRQPITPAQYAKAVGMNLAVNENLLCNSFFVDAWLSSPSSAKTTEQPCP